jgi:cation/acetate symporter
MCEDLIHQGVAGLCHRGLGQLPAAVHERLWKDCTTKGAVMGSGFDGLISSVALTVVSPSVWQAPLGNPKGSVLLPYASPALFSMTIGFVGIWLFSILDNSARTKIDRVGFIAQQVRSESAIGASGASGHGSVSSGYHQRMVA